MMIPLLMSSIPPRLVSWISLGILRLIKWDLVPEHEGLHYWDQRLIYNHAVLGHLGKGALLAMIDVDEYVSIDK